MDRTEVNDFTPPPSTIIEARHTVLHVVCGQVRREEIPSVSPERREDIFRRSEDTVLTGARRKPLSKF